MGLAPYGEPKYVSAILDRLVQMHEDGSLFLNLEYFGFLDGFEMTNDRFSELFDGPRRSPESEITIREMDIAASIQKVTEEIILRQARFAHAITGENNLCLAGGVALNCVANGRIARSGLFDKVWVQPASGDAGTALGACYQYWYNTMGNKREPEVETDSMFGALLGPRYEYGEVLPWLNAKGIPFVHVEERSRLVGEIADYIAKEKVVGLFQGRMEFGPRALGNRSIIADPRSSRMQSHLNLATKFRESFRPFAPIVLAEDAEEYFETVHDSPYMLMVDHIRTERRKALSKNAGNLTLTERINQERSDVPAVTHVDYSARIQTVDSKRNPFVHSVLRAFKSLTGFGILINTSFNVRGEPIVCTPEDAYRCFMRTGMDLLVVEECLLVKAEQPEWKEEGDWRDEFVPD